RAGGWALAPLLSPPGAPRSAGAAGGGGAALLSPSVTATWGSGGKLLIHKNGTVEQSGVNLSAPTFKFYQPKGGEENTLQISLTKDGFTFGIDPKNNDAIVYVDIP
ncbi:hypothetical protein, partial [Klebsiella pneumoniae]|uniref:hypothetical protein n=1 Tax=Klebsiella pneumoniae TaxID=573 RepID=UPI003B5BCBEA